MNKLSPYDVTQRVAIMAGAQVGKTECGNNWIGEVISHAPGPMLMVQPTLDMAKKVSKQRLAPMIESTPILRDKVKENREKDSGNTLMMKEFEGGVLMITGSNSAAGLRSMPIRDLFLDEVDAYPGDVDGEGDPVSLAEKRTSTFARRKILITSTPTIKGLSRIEKEYISSDQRRYFIACPHCGHQDFLTWSGWIGYYKPEDPGTMHHHIAWDEGNPKSAHMICSGCKGRVEERHKTKMLEGGEWRATATGNGTAGYHIPAMLSPLGWKSWADCAQEFLDSKDDQFRLRAWVNAVLGECFEEAGDSIEPEGVLRRIYEYAAEVPNGVGALTCSVDVQGNRLEAKVKGWGAHEESWLIAYTVLPGDPGRDIHEEPWKSLTEFITHRFTHESGRLVPIETTFIDSGGAHTDQVYRFCRVHVARRVYAVKGASTAGMPLVGKPSFTNRLHVPLFIIGTDTAKDQIYSRLKLRTPGGGYMHLPAWTGLEYVQGLCSERAVTKYVKGKGAVREYVKLRERNEPLDLEVYALAALHVRGPHYVAGLGQKAKWLATPPGTAELTAPTMRQRNPWMDGYS